MLNILKDKSTAIRRTIIVLLAIAFGMFLYSFNNIEKVKLNNTEGVTYEKAIVKEIVSDNIQEDGSRVGYQQVRLKILSGEHKGKIIDASSFAGYLYGADCTLNMRVIASISKSGENIHASVYSYYREPIIYVFVLLFLLMLWVIGGRKGLKSAIGLIFTFICIVFLFIPMLYKGYSPVVSAVIVVTIITLVSIYLIGGLSIKTISAILGTIIGVVIAAGCAAAFGYFSKISGYNVSEIESLAFVANNTDLEIGGLLFAGILIASLGAVMDVSMSISSTLNEIYDQNPTLNKIQLFKSGINVGRDMMGTMSNTLILAFTGGALNTLILNYAYAIKYDQLINMYSIGIEIMQGVSGSIGIILTVPIVSFISSRLLTNKKLKCLNKV